MFRVKQFMAVLMLALWLPATSHALLETAGVIHEENVPGSESDHDAADGFVLLPSNVSAPAVITTWMCILPDVVSLLPELTERPQPQMVGSGTSPPLPNTWQFVHRAALPVRAPSFAS